MGCIQTNFHIAYQELKDVADKNVADAGFQSAKCLEQVVEGLVNLLQPTDNDDEDNVIKMKNAIIQSTQMLP